MNTFVLIMWGITSMGLLALLDISMRGCKWRDGELKQLKDKLVNSELLRALAEDESQRLQRQLHRTELRFSRIANIACDTEGESASDYEDTPFL